MILASRLLKTGLLTVTALFAQTTDVYVSVPYSELTSNPVPHWNGALFRTTVSGTNGNTESVIVQTQAGRTDLDLAALRPAHLVLYDAAWSNGTAVLAASLAQAGGTLSHGLLQFDSMGKLSLFVRTNPFIPRHVGFAPTGELWVFGQPGHESGAAQDNLNALRRYSLDGTMLSSSSPLSSLGLSFLTRFKRMGSGPGLFVTADKVVLALVRDGSYVEFSLDGQVVFQNKLPAHASGVEANHFSLTPDGTLIGYFLGQQSIAHARLDKASNQWLDIPSFGGRLLGFVGGRALVSSRTDGTWVVRWSNVALGQQN